MPNPKQDMRTPVEAGELEETVTMFNRVAQRAALARFKAVGTEPAG